MPLDLNVTWNFLVKAARSKQLVTYGSIAQANNIPWQNARRPLNTLLWQINDQSIDIKNAMLGTLVVNRNQEISDFARASIIRHATERGLLTIGGQGAEKAFILEQREKCFAIGWSER